MRLSKGFNSRYTRLDLLTVKENEFHVSDMNNTHSVVGSAVTDPLDIARRDHM